MLWHSSWHNYTATQMTQEQVGTYAHTLTNHVLESLGQRKAGQPRTTLTAPDQQKQQLYRSPTWIIRDTDRNKCVWQWMRSPRLQYCCWLDVITGCLAIFFWGNYKFLARNSSPIRKQSHILYCPSPWGSMWSGKDLTSHGGWTLLEAFWWVAESGMEDLSQPLNMPVVVQICIWHIWDQRLVSFTNKSIHFDVTQYFWR